ncbi:RNA binding domain protein [Aspergillus niger]|uniref:RNA binding domain protein n=1 Tax=Aspergillus niger TaxID=5061 RepID=A0A100IDS3_ASPNG|nr:RNA binding domain protein [Aspergillus niger]
MNNIRQIQALNKRELENAISPEASWHADYRDTAYIYIGGLPYDLSEGDIITIFSQYGEPVHINLVRDKETGKSRGFCFLKYEDQRSTDLAVDNLGGATVLGRVLRVDHVRYKRRDDEEETDNVAKLMGDTATKDNDDRDTDDERRRRRKRRGSESREEEPARRPLLKEEIELQELIKNHDEEDPMKEFLIEEKKEEVALALEKMRSSERSSRRRDSHVEIGRPEGKSDLIERGLLLGGRGPTETGRRSRRDLPTPDATEIDMIDTVKCLEKLSRY